MVNTMKDIELIPNGDGTYTARKFKQADDSFYTHSQYNNVGKLCGCKSPGRCYSPGAGHVHICTTCGGVMDSCKLF